MILLHPSIRSTN